MVGLLCIRSKLTWGGLAGLLALTDQANTQRKAFVAKWENKGTRQDMLYGLNHNVRLGANYRALASTWKFLAFGTSGKAICCSERRSVNIFEPVKPDPRSQSLKAQHPKW